jgi:striatin 1/3/4
MAAYNGRPRKVMPEAGKDFPILNGVNVMTGPSTTPAAPVGQLGGLDRSNSSGSGLLSSQPPPPPPLPPSQLGQQPQQQSTGQSQPLDRDKDSDSEPRQLTAIYRPDDAGEWKEKLRQSHEASAWDRRSRYDDEEVKDEETEVEDEESSVVGEGDGMKIWKTKKTLRKSVEFLIFNFFLTLPQVISMP